LIRLVSLVLDNRHLGYDHHQFPHLLVVRECLQIIEMKTVDQLYSVDLFNSLYVVQSPVKVDFNIYHQLTVPLRMFVRALLFSLINMTVLKSATRAVLFYCQLLMPMLALLLEQQPLSVQHWTMLFLLVADEEHPPGIALL